MITFMKRKRIDLGEQPVTEWTLLEWKRFFSIKLFHFHKSDGKQDRFHTHAFNAYSLLLKGTYVEEVIYCGQIRPLMRHRKRLLYIPADEYHRITKSDDCWTLLFTGPWGNEFRELTKLPWVKSGNVWQETTCGPQRKILSYGNTIKLETI